jgi:DNA-binding transcriptional LysR family regulator
MNITFRQLRLFLALADTGSVSAAARAVHVTQPTASTQLRDISDAVGVPLYELVGKKLYLTEVGQELAATARAISQSWDTFEQQVDGIKGLTRGRLKIAVVSTAKYFMPRLLGAFCQRFPAIDVALEELNRDGVVQRLRENRDDLYIMSMPPADLDLVSEVLMPNPIVVILPTSDPLCRRASLPLGQLAQRRFILREKGSGTRMAVDRHFRQLRFRPDVRLELGSNEAVQEAVAAGLGVGVLSRHALRSPAPQSGVQVAAVDGFPLPAHWHIVHPVGRKLSPLDQAFKAHLHAHGMQRSPD